MGETLRGFNTNNLLKTIHVTADKFVKQRKVFLVHDDLLEYRVRKGETRGESVGLLSTSRSSVIEI